MSREALFPPGAPKPRGPYSPAVIASGRLLFVSSQGPLDQATRTFVEGPFEAVARQALTNLRSIVEASGGDLANAVKTTVFLADFDNFEAFNAVYAEFFPEPRPARTTVQSNLPFGCSVDVIVALDIDESAP